MLSEPKTIFHWFTRGTYPRLYVPIALVIVAVIAVRYYHLVGSEVDEARQRAAMEVQRTGHFLIPAILNIRGQGSRVQELLNAELALAPMFERLEWQENDRTQASAQRPIRTPEAPTWFVQWVALQRVDAALPVALGQGQTGVFRVVVDPGSTVDEVWKVVRSQLVLTSINVLIIFLALTLLLRANARFLSRLSTATREFQAGSLGTRMKISGTLETRAVAATFNAMAAQIEQLVTSLQQSESEQADQLHFTRQLVDSMPLPVFVRSARDICLLVNPAWEEMFGVSAAAVVGTPMPSYFDALEEDIIDITDPDDTGQLSATSHEVYSIQTPEGLRYVLYFKAPFSNRHGVALGTIAALVDVTERERSSHTLL